jgi:hypothetical protein
VSRDKSVDAPLGTVGTVIDHVDEGRIKVKIGQAVDQTQLAVKIAAISQSPAIYHQQYNVARELGLSVLVRVAFQGFFFF